ncbi:retrovirus-related pol polyprotein from transposon TNT 1-94, partial [Tanacetum coccineum]
FGDQQWKVTKGSLVVAHGNKRGSLYMVEVPYDGINAAIDGNRRRSRYYVTFIDDSSRKCLKFDNGGEYSSREFIEYCAENEIRMLKTVPEIPQENGVAERMNITLNERAKKEEWQGKEVSLTHLRIFGYDSYVKVKDVSRDKPDAKSMKCTFICYGSNEIGYLFWDLKDHKDPDLDHGILRSTPI